MRISFILQDLFTTGVEYATALLVRGFVARGYEVDLVVSAIHSDYLTEGKRPFEVPAGVNWVFLPSRKASRNILALRKYVKITDAHSIVIMSSNYLRAFRLASMVLRKIPQVMYVEHLGSIDTDCQGRPLPPMTARQSLLAHFFYKRCDVIATVSAGTKDAMTRRYPWLRDKLSVVYNPVVDNLYWEKIDKGSVIHPWLKEKRCPTFVAAGAHTGLKNHRLLIDAIERCQSQQRVRLVLFGRGALTPQYGRILKERGLEDCIALGGYTDNLPVQLKYADGFIVSSDVESFSIVLVEALAAGCPAVSTDCPYGPREVLDNGRYGRLVPMKDAEALAKAILELASRKTKPAVPDISWKRFTVEVITERYERVLGLI